MVALACCALCACGSLLESKAAPQSLYLLSMAGKPTSDAPALPMDLVVLKPRVRVGLDTDRIALLYPDRRLDYFANVRWSGPLDEVMQELALQEFRALAGLHNVSSDASVFASTYWLEIEVADFQAEYASAGSIPSVHVHLLARIGSSTDRRALASFEADAHEPASDNRLSAIVEAYNHASDAALASIVTSSIATLKSR